MAVFCLRKELRRMRAVYREVRGSVCMVHMDCWRGAVRFLISMYSVQRRKANRQRVSFELSSPVFFPREGQPFFLLGGAMLAPAPILAPASCKEQQIDGGSFTETFSGRRQTLNKCRLCVFPYPHPHSSNVIRSFLSCS